MRKFSDGPWGSFQNHTISSKAKTYIPLNTVFTLNVRTDRPAQSVDLDQIP